MKKLKRLFRSRWIVLGGLMGVWPFACVYASSDFNLTKQLVGVSGGTDLQGGSFSANFSWGEATAGFTLENASGTMESGYYGGRFGAGQTFSVASMRAGGTPVYFQNGLRIGVTVQAAVEIVFSDQVDPASIVNGIRGTLLQDHLGNLQNQPAALTWEYTPNSKTVQVKPVDTWFGNSVYDIAVAPGIVSINGYALASTTHTYFLTMANPREENVVTNALASASPAQSARSVAWSMPPFSLRVPPESLSDYAVLIFNSSSPQSPRGVDPQIIQEATRKARASGGVYQTPLRLLELEAYNPEGKRLSTLSRAATISLNDDHPNEWVSEAPTPIHAASLALWALDQEHRLWVKIPASVSAGTSVTAPVTRLATFALMGSALGSANEVFVFPTPWRPFGPRAGAGSGQSGTEANGMTFSNLPSECSIKIYTLTGGLVRELHHSDTAGPIAQETWDGNTAGGVHAASGVYLWRVESDQDGKNGKLMIIR